MKCGESGYVAGCHLGTRRGKVPGGSVRGVRKGGEWEGYAQLRKRAGVVLPLLMGTPMRG